MPTFRFPDAIQAVKSWLNGAPSSFASRLERSTASKTLEWELDLRDQGYPIKTVRLRLDSLFPAVPCELYVSAELCLKLPHVEEDGRVCLGETCQPADFERPVEAVIRALSRFRTEFLQRSANHEWREAELHAERLSYWSRFCDLRQKSPRGRPRPRTTLVDLAAFDEWAEAKIAAFVPKGSRDLRIETQVVTLGDPDPNEVANRYGFGIGTLVTGSAAFVRLPSELTWNPSTWPTGFIELDALIRAVTSDKHSVVQWLEQQGWGGKGSESAKAPKQKKVSIGVKPLLVVLCHGQELYGYQISQPTISLVTAPHAAPIKITRIDPAWALTRDHAATSFESRRSKGILILGAGSLGSPIIDVLARSGVGAIDVVDAQAFDPANVSRHLLGMSSILQGKAAAIAARLKKEIPGLRIRGFTADARRWCSENCTPGKYDLIVDLTAESSVRIFLAHTRAGLIGDTVVIHAWVEPYCAAAHVVATSAHMPWPSTDPAGRCVNAADYSKAQVRVNLPACSEGFHPYGSADILQAAGFSAERILDVIDHGLDESTVWSSVRSRAFFEALELPITAKAIVPTDGGPRDGVMLTRPLQDILRDE